MQKEFMVLSSFQGQQPAFALSVCFPNFPPDPEPIKREKEMTPLNLPDFQVKLSGTREKPVIFDLLRRKFVALTPEEWVRQHFIHFLIEHRGYPASLMQNEIQLKVGSKVLRADSVLYGSNLQPRMIIEYKAPSIPITQKVFDQISTYNLLLHVDYLIVSNGINHYVCKMDYSRQSYLFIKDVPCYKDL
jgi:hypothetical protein